MYRLRDFLQTVVGMPEATVPSDEIFCSETNLEVTLQTNKMQEALSAYTYTLVQKGWLTMIYNGRELTLQPGDLYIYSPGSQVTILGGSNDYHAACLIADEHMTLETPLIWSMIRAAYYPIAELGQPVVHIGEADACHLWNRIQEIIRYLGSSHHFLKESLRTLYTLFVLDLRSMMEQTIGHQSHSERTAELFINFIRLLPKHFVEHHDISFYAEELCITTTHLSRIVRQITGRTVVDHINQMLLMESMWLLQTSDLSIAAIAERLHFADQSSFGKFFHRLKGISPKSYRVQR